MRIPFLTLTKQNNFLESVLSDISNIHMSQKFLLGKYVLDFEKEFAHYNNVEYVVSVANGSEALEIILRALELPRDSEVLIPANTFIATAQAAIRAGLTPKLVDVNPSTLLAEAEDFIKALSKKTKVLLPVHLYGQIPNMQKIRQLSKAHNLIVVEDAAQSQGSHYQSNKMGKYSTAAATSFYPGKNLGAWGDGGAIVTNSTKIYKKALKIRNYGSIKKYQHDLFGFNSRLDEIQAAILLKKLPHLDRDNDERNLIAGKYNNFFSNYEEVKLLPIREKYYNNYHLYVVRLKKRNLFQQKLLEFEIETLIHYPSPIYGHKGLKDYIKNITTDVYQHTALASQSILSFPLYPGLNDNDLDYIFDRFTYIYEKNI